MGSVNTTNFNLDQTVRVFDDFYNFEINIPVNEYDIVYSYFLSQMPSKQAAGNFTVSLFRVAQESGVEPLTLLDNFKGITGVSLDVTMAYYLNAVRSLATLLGVGVPVTPNFYAARNVLQ